MGLNGIVVDEGVWFGMNGTFNFWVSWFPQGEHQRPTTTTIWPWIGAMGNRTVRFGEREEDFGRSYD